MRSTLAATLALALLLAAPAVAGDPPPAQPARSDTVTCPVGKTPVRISLLLPTYLRDREQEVRYRQGLGDRFVLFGSAFGLGRDPINISIIAEKDDPHATSTAARDAIAQDRGKPFSLGDIACVDTTQTVEGFENTHYRAYVVAAGFVFDVHVSAMVQGQRRPLTKESFGKLLETIRVTHPRRGDISEWPQPFVDFEHAVSLRMPAWTEWVAAETRARPADYVPPLVHAEMLRVTHAPDADCVAPYTQALALLAAKKDATPKERFAQCVGEEGLGSALHALGKYAEAVAHLQKAYDIARQIPSPVSTPIVYALARAQAKQGSAAKAVESLRIAIEGFAPMRALASSEADFASLRELPAFKALLVN